MYYISGTEFKGQQIKMIRLLLILSMVCTLSHALSCVPCPDHCDELKCCPSGEVTRPICGCCYVCASGTVYILWQ